MVQSVDAATYSSLFFATSHEYRPVSATKLILRMANAGAVSSAASFFLDPEAESAGIDHLLLNRWVL